MPPLIPQRPITGMGRNRIWSAISMSEGILERFGALAWSRAGRRGDGGNLRLRYENMHRSIKYHTASNEHARSKCEPVQSSDCIEDHVEHGEHHVGMGEAQHTHLQRVVDVAQHKFRCHGHAVGALG